MIYTLQYKPYNKYSIDLLQCQQSKIKKRNKVIFMKITYLGQAGLLFEKDGFKIMIDPYLSDSVEKINPKNCRKVPVDENLFSVKPNLMIFTHNHLDHFDPETVEKFINDNSNITVLAPNSVWHKVRKLGGSNNYVLFNRHTVWTENKIKFTAVKAEHSDPSPIGVIIESDNKKYYITGDTLYNEEIFSDIPDDIYALFLPINGVGNNMNMTDAARFAERVKAEKVIPIHIGMFDNITADNFDCKNKVVANISEEIVL